MTDAPGTPKPTLDTKTMMATAAGLWVFFGLTMTTLLKEVVLSERAATVPHNAAHSVLLVMVGFFVVNFLAIGVSQSISVSLLAREIGKAGRWLWAPNLLMLGGYLFMAWAAYGAAYASFHR